MISTFSIAVFLLAAAAYIGYCIWCLKTEALHIMHYLYLCMFTAYIIWIIPLMLMRMADHNDMGVLKTFDTTTYVGALLTPAFFFCICLAYAKGEVMFRKWMLLPFVIPVINILVILTDSYHHLQYEQFSVIRSEIVFGPFVYIGGAYSYVCLIASVVILIIFAAGMKSRLCWQQTALLSGGSIICLLISSAATIGVPGFEITATPLSFAFGILMNGIAIYRMHLLDIRPASERTVLESISDSYAVISNEGILISCNRRFEENFGRENGLKEGLGIDVCSNRELCMVIKTGISRSMEAGKPEGSNYHDKRKGLWYTVTVTPVKARNVIYGYAVVFKDVTELRRSLKQAEADRERLKEQEHLAFLGQMIGGLAHNLKSPIMGISGCAYEIRALNGEISEGIEDNDFNDDDIKEILSESQQWCSRIEDAAEYMSDIITVIKDQAVNAISGDEEEFEAAEVYRRCGLLLKHELLKAKCTLIFKGNADVRIKGSLNSLVQAAANMISNAIFSQGECGGGEIVFAVDEDMDCVRIKVIDRGKGIREDVKDKLFKNMITTKGNKGTGLGLYISSSMIKSSFSGSMYAEDTEGGGATVVISIPHERVISDGKKKQQHD